MTKPGGRRKRAAVIGATAIVAAALVVSGCTTSGARQSGSTPSVPVSPAAAPTVSDAVGAPASGPAYLSQDSTTAAQNSTAGAGKPPTPMELPSIDPATLKRFSTQQVAWSSCDDGLQCGSLLVPIDYQNPTGPTISLALIRHQTKSRDRIGSVVLNPGGPGGSGVQFLRSAWRAYDNLLQSRFDVVSFDPRGVGASDPIRCVSSAVEDQFVSYYADPGNAADVAHQAQLNTEFANGCEEKSARLLSHVGTVDTARDLDVLRAVLGDDKLTYIGESYGTFLGAIYAQLFPTRIRALVLDGVVDPTLDDVNEGHGQAKGFETALASFISNCVGSSGCALGRSSSDAESKLDSWIEGLTSRPLKGSNGRILTRMLAVDAVAAAMYSPASWHTLDDALRDAMKGNPAGMFSLADMLTGRQADGSYSNELEANVAINCADRVAASNSISAAAASALAGAKDGPTFGESLGWGNSTCVGWPVPAELAPGPVRAAGAPPILVIGTTRDPATPLVWARSLAQQLESGVLLSWDGDGHTAVLRSVCVDDVVATYVVSLRPPVSGTACPASG